MASIEECRLLREQGQYIQSISGLIKLQKAGETSADIPLELAQTYLVQGHINKALDVLHSSSEVIDAAPASKKHLATMLRCFAGPCQSATFREFIDEADKTYQLMPQRLQDASLNTDIVSITWESCSVYNTNLTRF